MKISTFTDGIVGEIALQSGVTSTLSKAERSRAVAKNLDPEEGFGKWHALKVGSTRAQVKENLGNPAETKGPDVWVFNNECAGEIPQSLTLYFTRGKVRQVVFSAPSA